MAQHTPPKPQYVAGVMGWPVQHSLSPKLHGYWLNHYEIQGRYDHLPVEPENLEHALHSLFLNGYAGCNLTLPHKTAAMDYIDHLTDTAKEIGAVNTIVVQDDGRLLGDNTDAYGFIKSLDAQCPDWHTHIKHALIIGAGGAAKAVIYGLKQHGITHITVANRTLDKAKDLSPNACTLKDIAPHIAQADLLVNTTSLGMTGQPDLDIDLSSAKKTLIVSDIVYTPRQTPLLQHAEKQGLHTVEGIDMLLYQAVPGFKYWFGITPEVTADLKNFILDEVKDT